MLNQKGKLIPIAVVVGILLVAYGVIVYFFIIPKDDSKKSDEKTSVSSDVDSSKIKLDVESGNLSSDKKMLLTLKLSGLEGEDAIEELRKDGNLSVEIDGQKAEIQDTATEGDDAIKIRARVELGDDKFKDFNDGKSQNLEVRAELNPGADNAASKTVSTNFKKGDKNSSLGQEIAFGEEKKNDDVQTSSSPGNKPQVVNTPKPTVENVSEKAKTKVSRPPVQTDRRADIPPPITVDRGRDRKGTGIKDDTGDAIKTMKDGREKDRIKKGRVIDN